MMRTDNRNWVNQIINGVPEGIRHDSAIRLVGRWYGKGLSWLEVAMLLVFWNHLNLPPLTDQELESIDKSTRRWEHLRDTSPMSDEEAREIMREVRKEMRKKR